MAFEPPRGPKAREEATIAAERGWVFAEEVGRSPDGCAIAMVIEGAHRGRRVRLCVELDSRQWTALVIADVVAAGDLARQIATVLNEHMPLSVERDGAPGDRQGS